MHEYTICPKLLEYSCENTSYINDVLFVFVPNNSKKICIDKDGELLKQYNKIIPKSKDLVDWYRFLTMTKDNSFVKIDIKNSDNDLLIDICSNSFDKNLITDSQSNYMDRKQLIKDKEINLIDKDYAKVLLNYTDIINQKDFSKFSPVTENNILDFVLEICKSFKELIELNGLFKLLYESNKERIIEKKVQLLFYGVAFSYCNNNNIKLSPEVDSGNGPVDFNLSYGAQANVNVEVKFADNPNLESGLWSQLDIYNKAERTDKSIYLIIKTSNRHDHKIEKLVNIIKYRIESKMEKLPNIVVIDGCFKESASKRK